VHIRPEIREKKIKSCIGSILKGLMIHYQIGQVELSQILDVPHGRVKSWLERSKPQADYELFRCAEFFKIPITYLVYGIWDEGYELRPKKEIFTITREQEYNVSNIERYNNREENNESI